MKKKNLVLYLIFCINNLFGQKSEIIFNNPADSLYDNYQVFYPKDQNYKAFLILLHEFKGKGEYIPYQSDLPKIAASKGILTIMPTLKTGSEYFGIDSLSQTALDELVFQIQKKYNLSNVKFYLGGFSIGGSAAIKYAQRTSENKNIRKPDAVFAIDPPLDFERLYISMQRQLRISADSIPNPFLTNFSKRIENEMGGPPSERFINYISMSPFSISDKQQQGIKKIQKLPIRIIIEPEIEWRLEKWNNDLYSSNTIDCIAFINELRLKGNNNATVIITKDKGYRQGKKIKNPHSWSIADPKETIKWLLEF